MTQPATPRAEPTTRRILDAARALAATGGVPALSVGDVAAAAAVSKALVLYHFRDKDSLLLALADDVGRQVIARERAAMEHPGPSHALDDYWGWLSAELERGDVRVLLSLAECASERVRGAARRVAADRRALGARHLAALFTRLGLQPAMPPALLADTLVAFVDGLAAAHALEPARDHRPAFDALWLALLTLSE